MIPPSGTCDGEACWTQRTFGFSYKDKSLANDGVESMRLADFRGISIKGRGAGLSLPSALSAQTISIYPKFVASDGVTTDCWYHDVSPLRIAPDKFKGRY